MPVFITNEDVSERASRVRDALSKSPADYCRTIDDLEWLISAARSHALELERRAQRERRPRRLLGIGPRVPA